MLVRPVKLVWYRKGPLIDETYYNLQCCRPNSSSGSVSSVVSQVQYKEYFSVVLVFRITVQTVGLYRLDPLVLDATLETPKRQTVTE